MRIVSLAPFHHAQPQVGSTIVVLSTTELPMHFGDLGNDVVFSRALSSEDVAAGGRLIFANLSVQDVRASLQDLEPTQFEYWADHAHLAVLCEVVSEHHGYAIIGLNVDESWVKLLVGVVSGDARSSADLVKGLEIAVVAAQTGKTSVETFAATPVLSEPSLASLLINTITPLAKPVKQYLPAQLVAFLYKILEKLR